MKPRHERVRQARRLSYEKCRPAIGTLAPRFGTAHTTAMKPLGFVGIGLIVFGLVLGVLHFTAQKASLGAAAGLLLGGAGVLFASKCST